MIRFFGKNGGKPSQKDKDTDNMSDAGQAVTNTDQGHQQDSHGDRKRVKTDFLVHDLKVPLAVIEAGVVSLLKRTKKYGPLTEMQEKVLARVLRNTKITQTLVNDVLELGRSRKGIVDLTNFRLSNLVERTLVEIFDLTDTGASEKIRSCTDLTLMRKTLEKRGIQLYIDEELWCQEVCQDEAKLSQILRNLLNNALKYRKSQVELAINTKDDALFILIADDGEGIPSVYHKKIFESYFQMDTSNACRVVRGHGVGLAGVMVLIEDMGGEISLESGEGKGAKFSVKVPLRH